MTLSALLILAGCNRRTSAVPVKDYNDERVEIVNNVHYPSGEIEEVRTGQYETRHECYVNGGHPFLTDCDMEVNPDGTSYSAYSGSYSGGYENPAPGDDGTPDCVPGQAPVYVGSNDPNGLDGDGDGWGCE